MQTIHSTNKCNIKVPTLLCVTVMNIEFIMVQLWSLFIELSISNPSYTYMYMYLTFNEQIIQTTTNYLHKYFHKRWIIKMWCKYTCNFNMLLGNIFYYFNRTIDTIKTHWMENKFILNPLKLCTCYKYEYIWVLVDPERPLQWETTWLKRPDFVGPYFYLFHVIVPLMRDHMFWKTTFGPALGWSL